MKRQGRSEGLEEMDKKELSVIIPHYNEEERIRRNYSKYLELCSYLRNISSDFEIILEEDGSTDMTKELLKEISEKEREFVFLSFPKKLGKGGGLEKGVMAAKGEYIILCDADFPVPFETIGKILEKLREGYDVVIPSRRHPKSEIDYPLFRRIFSLAFNLLFRAFFRMKISDTQIGVKGFRADLLRRCLPKVARGFAMDIEILVRARELGAKFCEIPTKYRHGEESKVNVFRDSFSMFKEMLEVWKAWKRGWRRG